MKLQGQLLQGASTPSTCSLLDTGTRPIKQGCVTYYTRQRTLLDRDVKPIMFISRHADEVISNKKIS